jgi:hypothetical protein
MEEAFQAGNASLADVQQALFFPGIGGVDHGPVLYIITAELRGSAAFQSGTSISIA